MRRIAIPLVVVAAASTAVHAQEAPPDKRFTAGIGVTGWLPQGDVDDFTGESLGIRPQFAYWIRPFVAVAASFDFVFVNENEGVESITYYAISVGGRVTSPRPAKVKPYGELMLGQHHLDGQGVDDGGLGVRLGGGATFATSDSLVLSAGITYSSASIDAGADLFDVEIDIEALVFEFGVAARF